MGEWMRDAREWTAEQREEHLRAEAEQHTQDYNDEAVLLVLAELAELRKDRARLDWMERERVMVDCSPVCWWGLWMPTSGDACEPDFEGDVLREVIDAAMERKA